MWNLGKMIDLDHQAKFNGKACEFKVASDTSNGLHAAFFIVELGSCLGKF
jgi:hypothetical protein